MGITTIGEACITAQKFAVLQKPTRELTEIGVGTSGRANAVAARCSSGLTSLTLQLATTSTFDVMCRVGAEDALGGIAAILAQTGFTADPANSLVAPLSATSLPKLTQALARAEDADDGRPRPARYWDSMASTAAGLCLKIADANEGDPLIGSNAIDAAGAIALGLLALERRESILKIIERICGWVIDRSFTKNGRESAAPLLEVLCRATYCASEPPADGPLREISKTVAAKVAGLGPKDRSHLSPILRQVGAAALHYGDLDIAELMAQSTLPHKPSLLRPKNAVELDDFEVGGGYRLHPEVGRPGMDIDRVPAFHRDRSLQSQFLEMEHEAHGLDA